MYCETLIGLFRLSRYVLRITGNQLGTEEIERRGLQPIRLQEKGIQNCTEKNMQKREATKGEHCTFYKIDIFLGLFVKITEAIV